MVGPAWIGGLAALMYLLDDNGYFPSLWIANRNLLISLAFGAATVLAYDSWRRRQWRPGAVIAPACLLVSVLATEGGIATFAYLFAYEVALGRGRMVRRGLALVPSIAVIILWRLVYNLQGYGASGGGFYFDPVREPLDYAVAVLLRGPFFLAGQWTGVPADLYSFLPPVSKTAVWASAGGSDHPDSHPPDAHAAGEPAGEVLADRHVSLGLARLCDRADEPGHALHRGGGLRRRGRVRRRLAGEGSLECRRTAGRDTSAGRSSWCSSSPICRWRRSAGSGRRA